MTDAAPSPALSEQEPIKVKSPYVGLVPYDESDARFFFGRERDQRRLIENMFHSRLTLLYGASGVGKSSLLRAGLLRHLHQQIREARERGETPDLAVVYFNEWQGDVLPRLRTAAADAVAESNPKAKAVRLTKEVTVPNADPSAEPVNVTREATLGRVNTKSQKLLYSEVWRSPSSNTAASSRSCPASAAM